MGQLLKESVDAVNWIYGVTAVIVFILGTIANSTTLGYFLSKKGHIPNLLYTSITAIDLLICIMILPVGLGLMGTSADWLSDHASCNAWGVIWNIANHMSIFLILVFSVCRTKVLLFPFSRTSKGVIKTTIISYLIFTTLECTVLPYAFDSSYSLNSDIFICHWDYGKVFARDSRPYFFFYALFNTVQRMIPFMVVIGCCGLSYLLLIARKRAYDLNPFQCFSCCKKKDRGVSLEIEPYAKHKIQATLTILLATITYSVLNMPNILYMIFATSDMVGRAEDSKVLSFDQHNYFVIFALVMCMALHSMANPIVCYLRMQCLRNYYKVMLLKMATVFQGCRNVEVKQYKSKKMSVNVTDVIPNPSTCTPGSGASCYQPNQVESSL